MVDQFTSKIFRAVPGSGSVKTTVPQTVATILGLEPGDGLVWTVDVGARTAIVRRDVARPKSSRG